MARTSFTQTWKFVGIVSFKNILSLAAKVRDRSVKINLSMRKLSLSRSILTCADYSLAF